MASDMAITRFVWDPVFDCVQHELDGSNNVTVVYTNEPQPYGGVLSQRRGSTTHILHADALGSTRALTDSSQTVTDTYVYDAWGNIVASTGSTVNPCRSVGRYGYYTDNATGLVYIRARMYQPVVARWASVDPLPLENHQSGHARLDEQSETHLHHTLYNESAHVAVFIYADDSPVFVTDFSGLSSDPCVLRNLCYCGPDVGSQLAATLKKAVAVFRETSFLTKRWWCNNPALWLSWDLYPECWERPGASPKCGVCVRSTSPDLQACVTVFGKKHNNWNVNYLLWGAMARLCNIDFPVAMAFVKLHKTGKRIIGASQCGNEFSDTLEAWVSAGYRFVDPRWPVPLTTSMPQYDDPDFEGCVHCPETYQIPSVPCSFRWFNNNDVI